MLSAGADGSDRPTDAAAPGDARADGKNENHLPEAASSLQDNDSYSFFQTQGGLYHGTDLYQRLRYPDSRRAIIRDEQQKGVTDCLYRRRADPSGFSRVCDMLGNPPMLLLERKLTFIISALRNGGSMNTYISIIPRIRKIQEEMKKLDLRRSFRGHAHGQSELCGGSGFVPGEARYDRVRGWICQSDYHAARLRASEEMSPGTSISPMLPCPAWICST